MQKTESSFLELTPPPGRERDTCEGPHHSAELGVKTSRLLNSHHASCTSDVLGKETTILPGGREAKHTTNVLALHTGIVAASAANSFTSHRHTFQIKTFEK